MMKKNSSDANVTFGFNCLPNALHIQKIDISISEKTLKAYLEYYGELRFFFFHSGKSCNNASLIFKETESYTNFLNREKKNLNGVPILPQPITNNSTIKSLIGSFGKNKLVFIHNIPHDISNRALVRLFSNYGKIQKVHTFAPKDKMKFGYIRFWDEMVGYWLIAQGKILLGEDMTSSPGFVFIEKFEKGSDTDPWELERKNQEGTEKDEEENGNEVKEEADESERNSEKNLAEKNLDSLERVISGLNQLLPFMGHKGKKIASLKYEELIKSMHTFLIGSLLKEIGFFEVNKMETLKAVRKSLEFKGDFQILHKISNNHIPSNLRFNSGKKLN